MLKQSKARLEFSCKVFPVHPVSVQPSSRNLSGGLTVKRERAAASEEFSVDYSGKLELRDIRLML